MMSEQKLLYQDVKKSGLTNFLAISDHFMKNLFSSHPSPDSLTDVTLACEDPCNLSKSLTDLPYFKESCQTKPIAEVWSKFLKKSFLPCNTDPVPQSTEQYHSILTQNHLSINPYCPKLPQYHQEPSHTGPCCPMLTQYHQKLPQTDPVPPSTAPY